MNHHRLSPSEVFAKIAIFLLLLGVLPSASFAQPPAGAGTTSSGPLPDAPQPKDKSVMGSSIGATSAFIGYLNKKSFFFPDIAASPGPLSTGKKFQLFVNESISPATILHANIVAAIGQARDEPGAYGQGGTGYADRFGADMARNASNSFFGTFVFASVFKQDPRFFPQSNPTLWGSIKYAAKRVVITQSDSGNDVFNTSGLLGPLAGETLANSYLPRSEQTGAKTAERFGIDLGFEFAADVIKNYWPKIFKGLGLNKLKVLPAPNSR